MRPSRVDPVPPRWPRIATRSPEETRALGESLGRRAFAGAVLLLEGPLGAGKTVLARGVAAGLGVEGPVTSPSFAILAIHPGRLPFLHLDLYRVNDPAELRAIDLAEVFGAGGVAAVEWPRWLLQHPPAGALEVLIHAAGEGERAIDLRPLDARWTERLMDLEGAGGSRP